jgi:hypothetical protein
LTRGLLGLVSAYHLSREAATPQRADETILDRQMRQALEKASHIMEEFAERYIAIMQRRQGPFVGCTHCPAKCLYRAEVNTLLSDSDQEMINDELASDEYASAVDRYTAVVAAVTNITQEWLEEDEEDERDTEFSGLSYCASLHAISRAGHSEYQQARISDNFKLFLQDQDDEEDDD